MSLSSNVCRVVGHEFKGWICQRCLIKIPFWFIVETGEGLAYENGHHYSTHVDRVTFQEAPLPGAQIVIRSWYADGSSWVTNFYIGDGVTQVFKI